MKDLDTFQQDKDKARQFFLPALLVLTTVLHGSEKKNVDVHLDKDRATKAQPYLGLLQKEVDCENVAYSGA
ncbi:hypothetical protein QE152_g14256 [Popillia japonica]|uniref:Uncharacterized protein n=1 Tax=Popillia japonica TaxID=7064 RepID=A0AAW1LA11_POPJA